MISRSLGAGKPFMLQPFAIIEFVAFFQNLVAVLVSFSHWPMSLVRPCIVLVLLKRFGIYFL